MLYEVITYVPAKNGSRRGVRKTEFGQPPWPRRCAGTGRRPRDTPMTPRLLAVTKVDVRVELPSVGGVPGDAHTLVQGYDYWDDSITPDP